MRSVANVYREALRTADLSLADSRVERKLLVAQVAGSAQAIRQYLLTRVPDGDQLGAALDALIPEIQKEDVVGNTLAALATAAKEQVKALALAAVGAGTWPVWVGTVGAFLGGVAAYSYDLGQTIGAGVIALLVGGGSAALFGVVRAFSAAGPAVAEAMGQAHGSLWNAVDSLGARAEQVFSKVVRPELARTFGPGEGVRQPPAGQQVRGLLKAVLGLTYALLTMALLFFGSGLLDAFSAYNSAPVIELPG